MKDPAVYSHLAVVAHACVDVLPESPPQNIILSALAHQTTESAGKKVNLQSVIMLDPNLVKSTLLSPMQAGLRALRDAVTWQNSDVLQWPGPGCAGNSMHLTSMDDPFR